MAKLATRMSSIVQQSFPEQHAQRLARARQRLTRDGSSQREPRVEAAIVHDTRADLLTTIEQQVIPRLLIAHNLPTVREHTWQNGAVPTTAQVLQLAQLAACSDLQGSIEMALAMLGSGLALETIFTQLVAPAARLLGTDWEEDLRSFGEVTVGLGTLHELVHTLAPRRDDESSASSQEPDWLGTPRGRAVLVGGRGEQHTLGLHIFGELLRQARWSVVIESSMPDSDVVRYVRSQPVDAVGLSISSPERLAAAAALINAIKDCALHRTIHVLVGGPVDLTHEAEQLGATFCPDACSAVEWLNAQVQQAAQQLPKA